jgi:hypothetical protein
VGLSSVIVSLCHQANIYIYISFAALFDKKEREKRKRQKVLKKLKEPHQKEKERRKKRTRK